MKTSSFFSRRYFFLLFLAPFFLQSHVEAQTVSSGVNSDGRDFYIGLIFPSYNKVADPKVEAFWGASALISSYTDNTVHISYFDDKTGIEMPVSNFRIPGRTGIQVKLDSLHMRLIDSGDVAEYKACHITADKPINVQFFSTGTCAGGSYLALATPALGKKYVVASYADNNGKLALPDNPINSSHGCFEIIAPFDNTIVRITPNSITMGGHPGSGIGQENPYTVTLKRGECYFVKSGRTDNEGDLSGSIVESNKPIAVLAGHENAALGGLSNRTLEGRDYMVEQMIPVDFWDTTGYVSIPLKDSQPSDPQTYEGTGENYRTYTWDSLGSKIDLYDQCIGVSTDLSAHRLSQPPSERSGVSCPVNFEATNGKKFSVMMYDLRNFANAAPYPAPSMMTIIPMSSWKTSFMWYVPANKFETLQAYYMNVIAPSPDFDNGIKASYNGGQIRPIKGVLSLEQQFKIIPGHPGYSGVRFRLYPGSYYATGPHPFILYNFGFRALDTDGDLGDFDGDDFFFSYANPAGASLSSGDPGNFKVTVDTFCGKWHICVHDGRKTNGGIRSVSLLDDSLATQFTPGKQSTNCHFDPAFDPANFGEVELPGTDSVVCFNVEVNFPIDSAYAAILITDNAGNLQLVELRYSPVKFSITPSSYPITFGNMKIGSDSCLFVWVKNTAAVPQMIVSADLSSGKRFNLTLVSSTLPIQLAAGDSLMMKLCFSASDTAFVKDTLNLGLSCLTIPIELTGRGAIGLITAGDLNLGKVTVGISDSRSLLVSNIGTKPFTLTNNWTITGSNAFSFTTSPVLPTVIQPLGQSVLVQVKYLPTAVGKDTAIIHWNTDIEAPYTQSVKSYSILVGEGVTGSSSVKEPPQKLALSVRPNPANGNSIFISFTQAEEENFQVQIFDVLGRELYKRIIIGSNTAEIPIRNLQNGIYYARVTSGAKIVTEKFEVVR